MTEPEFNTTCCFDVQHTGAEAVVLVGAVENRVSGFGSAPLGSSAVKIEIMGVLTVLLLWLPFKPSAKLKLANLSVALSRPRLLHGSGRKPTGPGRGR